LWWARQPTARNMICPSCGWCWCNNGSIRQTHRFHCRFALSTLLLDFRSSYWRTASEIVEARHAGNYDGCVDTRRHHPFCCCYSRDLNVLLQGTEGNNHFVWQGWFFLILF
jgi:hypothetical protein